MPKALRIAIIVLFGLILLIGIGGFIAYRYLVSEYEKPKLVNMSVFASVAGEGRAQGKLIAYIHNPNPVGVHIRRVAYEVYIEGEPYGGGESKEPFRLKPNDTTRIELTYDIDFQKYTRKLGHRDSAVHNIKLDATVRLLGRNIDFDHEVEENMPVIRPFETDLKNISLEEIKGDGVYMNADLVVKNPGTISFSLSELTYNFMVEEQQWSEGSVEGTHRIPAKGSNTIPINVRLRPGEALETGWKWLTGDKEKQYSLSVHTHVQAEGKDQDPTPYSSMTLTARGKFKLGELLRGEKSPRPGS